MPQGGCLTGPPDRRGAVNDPMIMSTCLGNKGSLQRPTSAPSPEQEINEWETTLQLSVEILTLKRKTDTRLIHPRSVLPIRSPADQ